MFDDPLPFIQFSTRELPDDQRDDLVKEVVGRAFLNVDFTPLDGALHMETETHLLPGITVTNARVTPHRLETSHDPSRDSDDFMLLWSPVPAKGFARQFGKEVPADGSAALMSCADRVTCETYETFPHLTVKLQRGALLPLLPDAEAALMRPIAANNQALRLLTSYLASYRALAATTPVLNIDLAHAVATHISDLVALAVGTNRDAAELASTRGLQAARLNAVKRWILARLWSPELTIDNAAAAIGVSPRSIQLLFRSDGTTFTSYVLQERLTLTYRRLSSPTLANRTIGDIAFGCGFGDLSYFNRCFRSAFGETPSDVGQRASTRHATKN